MISNPKAAASPVPMMNLPSASFPRAYSHLPSLKECLDELMNVKEKKMNRDQKRANKLFERFCKEELELSQEEMKKRQLKVPRNFAGGNFDRWISVVDIRLLKLSATASQEFVERGVTFVCQKVKKKREKDFIKFLYFLFTDRKAHDNL